MGDVKLLPCPNPWCGGEENSVTEFEVWFYIGCDYCGLRGPARKSEEAARAEWNTRPAPTLTPAQQAAEEMVEALVKIATSPHMAYDGDAPYVSEYSSGYAIGVVDGHRCAANTAAAALAKAGKP